MSTTSEIMDKALELPRQDRSELANKLIRSLDEDALSAEWIAELDKRVSRWESGESKAVSSAVLHREISERFAR